MTQPTDSLAKIRFEDETKPNNNLLTNGSPINPQSFNTPTQQLLSFLNIGQPLTNLHHPFISNLDQAQQQPQHVHQQVQLFFENNINTQCHHQKPYNQPTIANIVQQQ